MARAPYGAMTQTSFPAATDKTALEEGETLSPRFDANGLIAAVPKQLDVALFTHSERLAYAEAYVNAPASA